MKTSSVRYAVALIESAGSHFYGTEYEIWTNINMQNFMYLLPTYLLFICCDFFVFIIHLLLFILFLG